MGQRTHMPKKKINKWLALCVVSSGSLLSTVNASSIVIANPVLANEFSISMNQVQWVTTVYLIIVCSTMLLFGKIGDRIGSHKLYISGACVFTLGSLCCGFSSSFAMLLLSRSMQALGVALWGSTSIGLVATIFPLEQRGTAMGLNAVMIGLGSMLGPSLGGFILSIAPWPFIFFFNVPIGVLVSIFAILWLRSPVPSPAIAPPLDICGAVLLAAVISSLILFVSGGFNGSQWFVVCFIVLVPFLLVAEKKHVAPLLDFGLFKNRRFFNGNKIAFLSYTANTMVSFQLPYFLEYVWHIPIGAAGLLIMISALAMAAVAPLAGILSDRFGAMRVMPAALVVSIVSQVIALALFATPTIPLFVVCLILAGMGMGMLNTPNNSQIMTAVGKEHTSYASGFAATVRNLAFCLGTAVSAGLFSMVVGFLSQGKPQVLEYLLAFRCIVGVALALLIVSLILCLRQESRVL